MRRFNKKKINGTTKHNISALSRNKLLFILSHTNASNSCLEATLRGHTTLLRSQLGGHFKSQCYDGTVKDFQPSVMDDAIICQLPVAYIAIFVDPIVFDDF